MDNNRGNQPPGIKKRVMQVREKLLTQQQQLEKLRQRELDSQRAEKLLAAINIPYVIKLL